MVTINKNFVGRETFKGIRQYSLQLNFSCVGASIAYYKHCTVNMMVRIILVLVDLKVIPVWCLTLDVLSTVITKNKRIFQVSCVINFELPTKLRIAKHKLYSDVYILWPQKSSTVDQSQREIQKFFFGRSSKLGYSEIKLFRIQSFLPEPGVQVDYFQSEPKLKKLSESFLTHVDPKLILS